MSSSGASFWSQHGARERQQLVLISNRGVVIANGRLCRRNVCSVISATVWVGRDIATAFLPPCTGEADPAGVSQAATVT